MSGRRSNEYTAKQSPGLAPASPALQHSRLSVSSPQSHSSPSRYLQSQTHGHQAASSVSHRGQSDSGTTGRTTARTIRTAVASAVAQDTVSTHSADRRNARSTPEAPRFISSVPHTASLPASASASASLPPSLTSGLPYIPVQDNEELLPPPNFKPIFTLIQDDTTGAFHRPAVYYQFADDDPELAVAAALRSTGVEHLFPALTGLEDLSGDSEGDDGDADDADGGDDDGHEHDYGGSDGMDRSISFANQKTREEGLSEGVGDGGYVHNRNERRYRSDPGNRAFSRPGSMGNNQHSGRQTPPAQHGTYNSPPGYHSSHAVSPAPQSQTHTQSRHDTVIAAGNRQSSGSRKNTERHANRPLAISPLLPAREGVREVYILVDLGPDGKSVIRTRSLSSDWAVTSAATAAAPILAAGDQDENNSQSDGPWISENMLTIHGTSASVLAGSIVLANTLGQVGEVGGEGGVIGGSGNGNAQFYGSSNGGGTGPGEKPVFGPGTTGADMRPAIGLGYPHPGTTRIKMAPTATQILDSALAAVVGDSADGKNGAGGGHRTLMGSDGGTTTAGLGASGGSGGSGGRPSSDKVDKDRVGSTHIAAITAISKRMKDQLWALEAVANTISASAPAPLAGEAQQQQQKTQERSDECGQAPEDDLLTC